MSSMEVKKDPPTVEYNKLYSEIQDAKKGKDIYSELMSKSDNVIDAINRVVDVEKEKTELKKNKMTLHNTIFRIFETFSDIYQDLQKDNNPSNIPNILLKEKRGLYLGLFLVFFCAIMFVLSEA